MTAMKLDKFGGQLPAWDSRLLPDGQADYALNTYLFSGSLIGYTYIKLTGKDPATYELPFGTFLGLAGLAAAVGGTRWLG